MNWSRVYSEISRRRVQTVLAIQAVLVAATAFGLNWTGEQVSGVVIATGAVFSAIFNAPVEIIPRSEK